MAHPPGDDCASIDQRGVALGHVQCGHPTSSNFEFAAHHARLDFGRAADCCPDALTGFGRDRRLACDKASVRDEPVKIV